MRAGDGRLWQGILTNSTGGYDGYFAGTDPATSTQATEFTDDAVGYMKCFLMRQGWKLHCIKQLIYNTFNKTAAQDVQKARWCRKRNKIILVGNVKQKQHKALLDKSFINRRLGMTTWEIHAKVK